MSWSQGRVFGIMTSLRSDNRGFVVIFMQGKKYLPSSNRPDRRSQWPRGLRRRSSSARLLRLWVRIPPGARIFVCCKCCVLSGRGLCVGLITRPGESYRLWRVVVCDQETSKTRRLKPVTGLLKIQPQWVVTPGKQIYISCIEIGG